MSMDFEFSEMKDAEAFMRAVKERYGQDGKLIDDAGRDPNDPCHLHGSHSYS